MNYTLEEIYQLVGKEDKAAGITFKAGSEAFNNYGNFITAVFIYTQKEREELDQLIKNKPYNKCGYFRAKYLGRDLSEDKVNQLLTIGISSQDIVEILYVQEPSKNTFHSSEKREMIKINVPFNSLPKGRDLDWMYGFSKNEVNEGIGQSPKEYAFYLAGKLYYEPESITEEETLHIYNKKGDFDVKIEWEYLQIKYFREELNDDEKKRLAELYGIKKKEGYDILNEYLQQAGSGLKKLVKENVDQAVDLLMKIMQFKERRLTVTSKHPIFLDLDSYLHIYMRHVEEFQVNKHFEHKDNFQWNEEDVFRVMGKVIKEVEIEYQHFREELPDRRYSRYGDQSLYFQGDYYTFHIESNGRVSTFHKNRKGHEKE